MIKHDEPFLNYNENFVLEKFNTRNSFAFGVMYEALFNSFNYFTKNIYKGLDMASEDVVHDIFLYIWEHKSIKFESIDHLKGYIYLSIRNTRKNNIVKNTRKSKYEKTLISDENYTISQLIEVDVISEINNMIKLLPEECAKVFNLYIEGLEIKEIAKKLNKSESTIYNQRKMGIEILRKKLSKTTFLLVLNILFK